MNVKQKLTSAKDVVVAHRTVILVSALVVTTTGAIIQKSALKDHNEFLRKEGLYDKYYELNEYDVETP